MTSDQIADIARRYGLEGETVQEILDSIDDQRVHTTDALELVDAGVSVLHQAGIHDHGFHSVQLRSDPEAPTLFGAEDDDSDAPATMMDSGEMLRSRPSERYERLGLIGLGGMGEVRRVRDRDLNRTMAMKVVRKELLEQPGPLSRFIEEAQATAQLQHPGIVPVHELGRLDDGRFFFTMKEVKGRTFGDVIVDVHRASRLGRWKPAPSGWTFRRLIDAFHKACDYF